MTETPYAPPPSTPLPPAPPQRPPLRRSRDSRVIAGVSGGLARHLGIDPILIRVVFVVLTLLGGGGLFAYLAAWLLIPEEGRTQSAGQRLVGGGRSSQTFVVVILAIVAVLVLGPGMGGMWGFGPHFGPPGVLLLLAAVALGVWLVRRDDNPTPPSTALTHPQPVPTPGDPVPHPTSGATAVTSSTAYETAVLPQPAPPLPPAPPPPPKPRSVLGLLTLSAAALTVGALVALALSIDDSGIGATTVLSAGLAVIGLGLLAGAWYGRSRLLIVVGILLSMATAISAATPSDTFAGGVGERTWRPTTVDDVRDEFRLGIGEGTLDLRNLDVTTTPVDFPISATLGVGELIVLLPDDVDVQVDAKVGLGQITVTGEPEVDGNGQVVDALVDVPDETATISLNLETGMGAITVRHSNAPQLFTPGGLR